LLASVLAEGDASRLRARMVHRDHNVTDVGCMLGTFGDDDFFVRDPSLFQVVVFHPGAATTELLLKTIDEEIGRLAAEGPTKEELARVVATSSADVWRNLDSILSRSHIVGSLETIHGSAELIDELPARLGAVTPADVAAAAADLSGQHRAILELQPAKS
jgi:predicted Zn-dependent peptidase